VDLNELGAVVVKGILKEPWDGNDVPRMVEVPGGLVNAIGLQNPGVEKFIAEYMPFLRRYTVPVIVNVWGRTEHEYVEVCERLTGEPGVHALELNISCPNIKAGGIAFGTNPETASRLIARCRAATALPLIPKLAPNVSNIALFAKIAEDAGADAISLINTIPAMVIDVETRRPVLANVVGGLSGPAIHPVAVKLVWEAAKAVRIPVIAMGGITCARDALEFVIAGATAVAVGTANFTNPATAIEVIAGMRSYLERHDMSDIRQLIGTVQLPARSARRLIPATA
jgi:dihydroorotate dehydrogenase (NAD+) catalytic subunit